ncbi:MAG: plastocyanin [Pseudonocardiales bacterium]|nr:MAG: plastocyanin [Pseudonocardiales bacterium]
MNRYSFAAAAAALSILLASCSSSKSDKKTSAPPAGSTSSAAGSSAAGSSAAGSSAPASSGITIKDFGFSGTLTVKPGEKVTVTNKDSTVHTLTDEGGMFDTGDIEGNATGSFTAPTAPGTYKIKCRHHPDMHGTLVVKG